MRIDSGIWPLSLAGQRTAQGMNAEEAKLASDSQKAPQAENIPQKETLATNPQENQAAPQSASFAPERRLSLQEEMEQQVEMRTRALAQMRQQMADMAEKAEKERESERIEKLCFEIAERVFAGDKVPGSDLSFLRKHKSDLYARAILLRVKKRKPFEYKRLTCGSDLYDKPGRLVIKGVRNDKYMISGLEWRPLPNRSFGAAFDAASGTVVREKVSYEDTGSSGYEAAAGTSPDAASGMLLDTKG